MRQLIERLKRVESFLSKIQTPDDDHEISVREAITYL